MNSTIEEIDKGLSSMFVGLQKQIQALTFKEIFQGTAHEFEGKLALTKEFEVKGIYQIEIKNTNQFSSFEDWVKHYQELWEEEEKKLNIQSTPNFVSYRIKAHKELLEWIPLYIGKSMNIGDRVRDHFLKQGNTDTYAMKLKARTKFSKEMFRVSIIKLDVRQYETIVSIAENLLSDRINPLIGKHQKFNISIDFKE